jgi:ribosomal protein S15P/S13E
MRSMSRGVLQRWQFLATCCIGLLLAERTVVAFVHSGVSRSASCISQNFDATTRTLPRRRALMLRDSFEYTPPLVPTSNFDTSERKARNVQLNATTRKLKSFAHQLGKSRKDPQSSNATSQIKLLVYYLKKSDKLNETGLVQHVASQAMQQVRDCAYADQLLRATAKHTSISARLLGEAVEAMARDPKTTVAGIEKKWKRYSKSVTDMDSRTFNAYLRAVLSRGWFDVAHSIYMSNSAMNLTDSYSFTCMIKGVQESLLQDEVMHAPAASRPIPKKTFNQSTEMTDLYTDSWQWKYAINLLSYLHQRYPHHINNAVISSVFQLNHKLATWGNKGSFPSNYSPPMATATLKLWQWMQSCLELELDAKALSHVLQCLEAEAAIDKLRYLHDATQASNELALNDMGSSQSTDSHRRGLSWVKPNVYNYAVVLASCLRDDREDLAWHVYQYDMPRHGVRPNIVVYNTVLQVLVQALTRLSKRPGQALPETNKQTASQNRLWIKSRVDRMLQVYKNIVDAPQSTSSSYSRSISPDLITYNQLLSGLSLASKGLRASDWTGLLKDYQGIFTRPILSSDYNMSKSDTLDSLSLTVLADIKKYRVSGDATTFRCALELLSGTNTDHVYFILDETKGCGFDRDDIQSIYKAAMMTLAKAGNTRGLVNVIQARNETVNDEIALLLLTAYTRAGDLDDLLPLCRSLYSTNERVIRLNGATVAKEPSLQIKSDYYSNSIVTCILAKQHEIARELLLIYEANGMTMPRLSIERIARSYAYLVLQDARIHGSSPSSADEEEQLKVNAKYAYTLVEGLQYNVTDLTLSTVCKACAVLDLTNESLSLLKMLLRRVVEPDITDPRSVKILSDLRQFLFRYFASQARVNAALKFAKAIQAGSDQYEEHSHTTPVPLGGWYGPTLSQIISLGKNAIGMTSSNWKYVLIAASKSGHWRACLSTMQCLQSTLESTNPRGAFDESDYALSDFKYNKLAPCLSIVTRCLSIRSQYAWAVRVIDDWIDWTGRRPPLNAVFPVIRILCSRGRGEEVNRLLIQCTRVLLHEDTNTADASYGKILFASAITSLYREGLQSSAEDALIAASQLGIIDLNMYWDNDTFVIDLHDMNLAMAHSCVRAAFKQEIFMNHARQEYDWKNDVLIITGRGRNSQLKLRPVIRPEVQRMLVEEFYPPLNTISVPGNMGALRVPSNDIASWLEHQESMKVVKMMSVAAVLKSISSGDRLRSALIRKARSKDSST